MRGKYVKTALLFLLVLTLLSGCARIDNYTYPDIDLAMSNLISPKADNLFLNRILKSDNDKYSTYSIQKLATVLAIDSDGESLGLLYDSDITNKSIFTFKVYPALYIFNLDQLSQIEDKIEKDFPVTKIIDAEKGYKIYNADLNKDWIVWVETNSAQWKAYQFNRKSKERKLLAEGQLLNQTPDDLPMVSLYQNQAVLNINDTEYSKIMLYNLSGGTAKTIEESNTKEKYYGSPKLYKDKIVWHARNILKGSSEVFLYNINNDNLKKLSSEAKYPTIWENYVAWISPLTKEHKDKISVYNLGTEKNVFTTTIDIGDISVFYKPSIANGKITWYDVSPAFPAEIKIKYYDLLSQETKTIIEHNDLSYVFVPNNLQIYNGWITYMHPLNMVPPPEHHTSVIGSLLLKVTD